MLLKKEPCKKCRSERAVRPCPRLRGKNIGWICCNSLRVDQNCPDCPYAVKSNTDSDSPFPAFRADSNTEYVQAVKRFIDLWCYLPNPQLDGDTPASQAALSSSKILSWLGKFQYPANFPIDYLMDKLNLQHDGQGEPQTPESVVSSWMEAVIAHDWNQLRQYTANALNKSELAAGYEAIISQIPGLRKAKKWQILHAGAGDDGVSAMVALEINQKYDWTVILAANRGIWQIRQNLNGSPQLYYAQNKLFHSIATALGQGNKDTAWQLISQNLPLYPDCADLYYYRALYWQLSNDPQKSRADLLVALALDNHFHSAAHALAALYLGSGELAEALDWLRLLNDEKPDDLDVQNNLAACEAGLGNTERAVEIWNAILRIAPNYELARKNLERYQR